MNKKLKDVNLINELDITFQQVETQLVNDQARWGDTWKERGLTFEGKSQEERFINKILEYFEEYKEDDKPMPWTKIIGEAHIAMVRERKLLNK
jgi:hypothetical protein